jgi:hypothetical protein
MRQKLDLQLLYYDSKCTESFEVRADEGYGTHGGPNYRSKNPYE